MTSTTAANPVAAPIAANRWLIAIAVALGALMEIIDTSIVNVALVNIQASVGATLQQVSWVVSGYAIANVVILPLSAWIGDRIGRKRYFLLSLVGFTLASVLCGISTTLPMLIVARVFQGLTGGGLLAKAQAILFETFPREDQPKAQAFFGAVVIAGPTIGPTLGGYIVSNIDWRWIFFINVPVGIGAFLLTSVVLPADERKAEKGQPIDWWAILMLAVGLGCLQTFLEEGQSEDWFESAFVVNLAIFAALGLTLFVWRSLDSKHPVVDLRVLRFPSLWAGSVLSIVLGIALYGTLFSIPIFAQTVLNYTSQQTGLLLLPGALAAAISMPLIAKLNRSVDPRALLIVGALTLSGAVTWLSHITLQTGSHDLFWPLIVRAAGTSMMFMPLTLSTLGPIPKERIAAATGLFNLTRQLGGSIGVALLATFLANRQAFHTAVVGERLGVGDPLVQERVRMLTQAFISKGFDFQSARDKALAVIEGSVRLQAAVLSFSDTFLITVALIVATIPLVFILGRQRKQAVR
jgi:DHA2 family multidrug resistance protein